MVCCGVYSRTARVVFNNNNNNNNYNNNNIAQQSHVCMDTTAASLRRTTTEFIRWTPWEKTSTAQYRCELCAWRNDTMSCCFVAVIGGDDMMIIIVVCRFEDSIARKAFQMTSEAATNRRVRLLIILWSLKAVRGDARTVEFVFYERMSRKKKKKLRHDTYSMSMMLDGQDEARFFDWTTSV